MFIATCFDSCESSSGYTRTIFIAYRVFVHILGCQNVHKSMYVTNMVLVQSDDDSQESKHVAINIFK
jgi:hypothetical protein